MDIPLELKYTKDHIWVRVNGGEVIIGITYFAQRELGDIVFVDVDSLGKNLVSGEVFGSVEAVKAVSDLYLPVSGEILEFNPELENFPEYINQDPYGKGWIAKVKIYDNSDLSGLLSPDEYKCIIN